MTALEILFILRLSGLVLEQASCHFNKFKHFPYSSFPVMFLQELGLSLYPCPPLACKQSLWLSSFIRASKTLTILSTLLFDSAAVTVQQNAKSLCLVRELQWHHGPAQCGVNTAPVHTAVIRGYCQRVQDQSSIRGLIKLPIEYSIWLIKLYWILLESLSWSFIRSSNKCWWRAGGAAMQLSPLEVKTTQCFKIGTITEFIS